MALSASKKIEFILALCLFLIGVSIYLLWRDEHLLIHRILHASGMDDLIVPLRKSVADINVPEWIRFALPDGLWSTSYILLIDVWVKRGILWTSFIPFIGVLSELLQLIGRLPGTFDTADLLAYSIPYFLYVLIINQLK